MSVKITIISDNYNYQKLDNGILLFKRLSRITVYEQ